MAIPFNKPFLTGKETHYIYQAVLSGKISGDGVFTEKCHEFFNQTYGFQKCLLTTSCTAALEMSAMLLNIKTGDEIIMPSYTFVSTANAFVLRGATIRFADSSVDNPNIDASKIESLVNENTRAIVVVHYAGIACDMDAIMQIALKYNLFVVEDAAPSIDSYYKGKPLGSIGHLSTFSFHETKNIISGEGGMLVINDASFVERAEIIREKGTNRSKFFRGEIDKYNWVDIGSSFLPSDVIAAFLFAQLENLPQVQKKRVSLWEKYYEKLYELALKGYIRLPNIPAYATNNGHSFYIIVKNLEIRQLLIQYLKSKEIHAVFHYLPLHSSPYFLSKHDGRVLINSDYFSDCLIRLPLFYELSEDAVELITNEISYFFNDKKNHSYCSL